MATAAPAPLNDPVNPGDAPMRYRALTIVFTAAALVAVPTAGFAQGAPQPAPSREAGLQFADEDDDDDDGILWYVLGGVAVVTLAFLLFLDDDDDDDLPVSP
jgi:hypothetical protein